MQGERYGATPRVNTGSMNWTNAGYKANDKNTVISHELAITQAFQADYQHLYGALGSWTLRPTIWMMVY